MFERYDGSARRAVFFARAEVGDLGGHTIESEHLLLGVRRAAKGLTAQIFATAATSLDDLRNEILKGSRPGDEKLPATIEIPFNEHTKRILRTAPTEADRLGHDLVGTEHLLLSILVEPDTTAARMLLTRGITFHGVQQAIVQSRRAPEPDPSA